MVRGNRDLRYGGAGLCENVYCGQNQVAHLVLRLVEALLEHADAHAGDAVGQPTEYVHARRDVARRAGIVRVVSCRDLERGRRVLHGAGHRTGVVDGLVRAEPDSEMRHEPERGLVTDDPAVGRGNTDGATLVAAERDIDLVGGHGRTGARRRSTGDVLAVVGVQRTAVVADATAGPEAATQPVHHVLADDGAAGFQDARDHGGIEVGDEAVEGEGAVAHRHSGDRDVVLEAYRLALQRALGRSLDSALPHPGIER